MKWHNRVKELRVVKAGSLIPDERNWRVHPTGQRRAMEEVLNSVGWSAAAIVRETPEGLVLVDGHLRAGMDEDEEIPVLIVDLTEQEAGTVMATMDPLSQMAEVDTDALKLLVDDMLDVGTLMTGHLNDILGTPPWTAETDRSYVEAAPSEETVLDVIGNAEATMSNYEKMLEAGLQPIPIITRGVATADIDRMVETAPLIALGGIFGTTMKERSALRWMIDQLPEGYLQHWLGFTDGPFVRHYRPTSFDSSNWVQAAKWGRLHNYLGNFMFGRKLRYGLTLTRKETRNIRSMGFDPRLLGISDNWRMKKGFNLVQCLETAMYVRWMRDLEALNVKMFFACSSTNRGLAYNLFHHYIHNGEDCIGLPTVATVKWLMANFPRPRDVTQESSQIVCKHW